MRRGVIQRQPLGEFTTLLQDRLHNSPPVNFGTTLSQLHHICRNRICWDQISDLHEMDCTTVFAAAAAGREPVRGRRGMQDLSRRRIAEFL